MECLVAGYDEAGRETTLYRRCAVSAARESAGLLGRGGRIAGLNAAMALALGEVEVLGSRPGRS